MASVKPFGLLVVSLALGWAGVSRAAITLAVDPPTVREEGGTRAITVTAKMDAKAAATTVVSLGIGSSPAPTPGSGALDREHGRFVPAGSNEWFDHTQATRPGGDWKAWYNSRTHINSRFAITLPTLVIPQGKKEATGTITLTPTDNDERGFYNTYDEFTIPWSLDDDYPKRYPDLVIKIEGLAGGETITPVTPAEIRVTDDEKLSRRLTLSFSPASLSKDAGPTQVTVTATLNGAALGSDQTFTLVFVNAAGVDAAAFPGAVTADSILTRDTDYSATSATLRLRRGKTSAKATITLDPKGRAGRIVLKSAAVFKGVDLNLNGSRRDTVWLFTDPSPPQPIQLTEAQLGCTPTSTGPPSQHDVNFDGRCSGLIREARVGLDLNGDGVITPPANDGQRPTDRADFSLWPSEAAAEAAAAELEFLHDKGRSALRADERFGLIERLLPQVVSVPPHFFAIKADRFAALKGVDGLTAAPATVREDGGQQNIALRVTLENALADDARVAFTIEPQVGRRDIDYAVSLRDLVIPAGRTSARTVLALTAVDNSVVNEAWSFEVVARVGADGTAARKTITIVDDETPTSEITLVARPAELAVGTGADEVTVTGTINGKSFAEDVNVVLVVTLDTDGDGDIDDADRAATRDTEYTARLRTLTIPAGEVRGSTTVSITPLAGGNKKVGLTALRSPVKNDNNEDVAVTTTVVTLKGGNPTGPTTPGPLRFADAVDVVSTVFEYPVGTAIEPFVLPAATGGIGDKTYSVSTTLPAGLSFDATTRTLSGTPTRVDTATVIYTVIDSAPEPVNTDVLSLTFEIGSALPLTAEVARLTSTYASVREDGALTAILLTATLAAPAAQAETVLFTLGAPSTGTPAVRDADYTAALGGSVVVAAGETQGRTMLTLSPLDNAEVDGHKYVGIQAAASGGSAQTDLQIADDETPSTALSLAVAPHTISEDAPGVTELTVTATLDGKGLDEAITVTISIDPASAARRDWDYSAVFNPSLVIPAGATSGSLTVLINPTFDRGDEGNETITLIGSAEGLTAGSAQITLADAGAAPTTSPEATPLAFADGTSVDAQEYTAGTEISALELPAASGGTGDVTYSVSGLPAGLSFDAVTRTISGTPAAATDGVVAITYTATDGAGDTASLTFAITVNASLTFADFFSAFAGAGKVVPTASDDGATIREFVVGEPVTELVLPAGRGGTAPLTYSLSPPLPAGLAFDPITRTISGTPQAEGDPIYTYTVTDVTGASVAMLLQTRPAAFALTSNYPNPFNPATTIQYALPQAADVQLTVYNVVGQPVRTLVAEHQSAGRYLVEWDATDDSGHSLSSGLYFYRLQAGGAFHAVKKMLLFK